MINLLRQIPGPWFLLYYSIYALICMIIGRIIVKNDGTQSRPVPENAGLDSTDAALLANGFNSILRTRIFSMLQADQLKIFGEKKDAVITSEFNKAGKKDAILNPIDAIIHDNLKVPKRPGELFNDRELKKQIDTALTGVKMKLLRLDLIRSAEKLTKALYQTLLMAAIMLAPGAIKLMLGVKRGKPVGFLVILLIASIVAIFLVMKPWGHATALGAKYISVVRHRFDWVRKRKKMPNGVDPTLMVALFGTGVAFMSASYPSYSEAFSRGRTGSGGCGGGCGGASGSGGCSGGCGGGCGGCGGCGG